ncbi:ClpX C4-type zinc finger [Myxococcus fulvus]|uniref:ClpX C4-type zinc finger n=1 Tax=Myxococcus fulvus TaxID=33 RepID=A0A511TCI1_MYXFU|nr:hypothetical protein MFUL124B02_43230 [Myxococcus fulvus 124B02]GEN11313.1 hypothetical protein MFU01_63500 [Myxococcus fulvus]SEU39700.1 ClpX C4-type zinc finger [Myxococcus fulvus]
MDKKDRLDRSCLPEGVSFDRKEGLYAVLGPGDRVVHVGAYEDGKRKPGTWALDVAPDGSWARVERHTVNEWDRSAPGLPYDEEKSLATWGASWIRTIANEMHGFLPGIHLQCSFCEKYQREVRHLIVGNDVRICDECIGLCNGIIKKEQEGASK